ncbi:MAG: DUF4339 domain-containing protein [Muribaculaceae bacterium]|nr:DUF4339 domain-containing protein [Muribaculaceae bacterium]
MKFYIAENGKPAGPFEAEELLAHGLTVNSQVWNESMDGWQRASSVPELMQLLNNQQVLQSQQSPYQPPVGYGPVPNPEAAQQAPYQQPQQSPYQPPTGYGSMPNAEATQQAPYQPQQSPYQPPTGYDTTPNPEATQQAPYQPPQYQQPQQQWAQPQYQQPMGTPPKDWKAESIIVTVLSVVCCCNPFSLICGIVAIVNAGKVGSAFYRGDRIGAEQSANSAKTWTLIAIALMVLGIIFSFWLAFGPSGFINDVLMNLEDGMEIV